MDLMARVLNSHLPRLCFPPEGIDGHGLREGTLPTLVPLRLTRGRLRLRRGRLPLMRVRLSLMRARLPLMRARLPLMSVRYVARDVPNRGGARYVSD